ncbi:P-loop containing nucleoside triphosphate hydrolase protein [Ramaria rubella]|nr:P-loop containing nucleoside triphosphate hydrolase protein [Ramaria rubella]
MPSYEHAIAVQSLTYSHVPSTTSLNDVNLYLPPASRTLLIGANGAGKSTLLQILAGKRLTSGSDVRILGRDVFRDSPPGVTYLGTEWAMNPVVRGDLLVSAFLDSVGGYRHKARRDILLDILDVDLDWHMHAISDGERRRVQLVMGLMAEWDILLLDEVHDRQHVSFGINLTAQSEGRGATILYATHIFDGLNSFPTHVLHMRFGKFVTPPIEWKPSNMSSCSVVSGFLLHTVALKWLKEDKLYRKQEEERGNRTRTRGARRNQTVPSDSEVFYKKYDYGH